MLCKRYCLLILVIPLYFTFSFLEYVPLLDTFEHKPTALLHFLTFSEETQYDMEFDI